MKRIVIGALVLATAIACAASTSNEPVASPNAKQQMTTTTGAALDSQRASSTNASDQPSFSGMSAGGESELAEPGAPKSPPVIVGVPRTPAPANTGDPCPSCPERH